MDVAEARTTASPERIAELALHRSIEVRFSISRNPAVGDDVILSLIDDNSANVRISAADAAKHRGQLHELLSRSPFPEVRATLAGAASLPLATGLSHDLQLLLARDEAVEVRHTLARLTAYRDVFDLLLADGVPRVRGYCAHNPRISKKQMSTLVADGSWVVRACSLAGFQFPTDDQVIALAKDRSAQVRWAALMRFPKPHEVIDLLLHDSDEMNRNQAEAQAAGLSRAPASMGMSRTALEAAFADGFH